MKKGAIRTELKPLEVNVLRLISLGFFAKEIGEELGIETHKVHYAVLASCRILKAKNAAHVVAKAFRNGILSIDAGKKDSY